MSTVRRLRFRAFVAADEFYHVARTQLPQGAPPIHTHDFAEVFWLEHGRGLHLLNGGRQPLEAGDLVWIEPADVHGFQVRDAAGCALLNVAFSAETLTFLRRRYFPGTMVPAPRRLERAELTRYSRGADALASGRQTQLRLDTFLLNLLQGSRGEADPVDMALYPGWLQDALRAFAQPAHLDSGTRGLARLAGRCPEHVNRVIRQVTGKTATDVVNEQRLYFAARQLRMTDRKILDLAFECGLGNLGYFYRLFAKQFGVTPRQYRLRQQALVR